LVNHTVSAVLLSHRSALRNSISTKNISLSLALSLSNVVYSRLCANFLFTFIHTSTLLNTDCLLAQIPHLHSHTQTQTRTHRQTHTHTHTQVFRIFQQNMCQNVRVKDRSPSTPPLLLFSSSPISLFPSGPRHRHAVLFLAYWCFFISQCLFVAQKNYRGLPSC